MSKRRQPSQKFPRRTFPLTFQRKSPIQRTADVFNRKIVASSHESYAITMGENNQNTNLASEYYVLSMLYRIGADAYLTLGNKKSVDIVVVKGGETLTIDVKGLKGTTNFPIDTVNKQDEKHYLIFVSFLNNIADPDCLPEVYIVPSQALGLEHEEIGNQSLIYQNPKNIRRQCARYLHTNDREQLQG